MTIFDVLLPLVSDPTADLPQSLPQEVKMYTRTEENTFCVARADMGQDPTMTLLGGSFIINNESITTQRAAAEGFEPTLMVTDFSGSSNSMGETTTHLLIQPTGRPVRVSEATGATYDYTVYDVPVAPIQSAFSTYSTFIKDYEEGFSSQTDNPELAMLDVYGTILSMTEGALNEAAQRENADIPLHPGSEWNTREKEELIDYFKEYALSNPSPAANYKNIIYPHNSILSANTAFKLAEDAFPFFVNFDINLATSGKVCDNLIETTYSDRFTAAIAATIDNGDVFERKPFVQQNSSGVSSFNPRVYDANLLATYDATSFMNRSVVLGSEQDRKEAFPESQPTFSDTIEALQYLMDMRIVATNNASNAIDISLGNKCYSEVIVYRIAKFSEEDNLTPVQNFYFFNSPRSAVFNFMDTQVVPGKTYTYKVFSYSFVAASVYEYSKVVQKDTYDIATITTKPAPKVVENFIFETTAFVTSLPPVAPQVDFRSFIGEENKIQVLLQDSVQRITQQPISLSYEEEMRMMNIRESQGILPTAPVRFFNDDDTKLYEIYRLSGAPFSVDDFSDALWRRVTDHAILDAVQPDKTYYYMFRTVDNHGNVSNPSPPYEVTLIGGVSPYVLVNQYEYPSSAAYQRSSNKGFKRFLRLCPSLQQLMIRQDEGIQNKDSSLNVNRVSAGVATKGQVWGKKYKIRIISKETGKKIDFNIKYDYNFEYREQ